MDEYLARAVYEHMQLNADEVYDSKYETFPSYLLIKYCQLSITAVLVFDSTSGLSLDLKHVIFAANICICNINRSSRVLCLFLHVASHIIISDISTLHSLENQYPG